MIWRELPESPFQRDRLAWSQPALRSGVSKIGCIPQGSLRTIRFSPGILMGHFSMNFFLSPIAEPDFCAFDAYDHAGGEVHSATKHIAFLDMLWSDMNVGTDLYLWMSNLTHTTSAHSLWPLVLVSCLIP